MALYKGDLANLAFLLLAFALMWLGLRLDAWLLQRGGGQSQGQLITEANNTALSLRLAGLCLGLALGLSAPLSAPSRDLAADLAGLALSGLLMLGLLFVARLLNERLLVRGLDNTAEILQGNLAVGLVELGSLLASGLVLRGAFTGSGALLSGVVFFLLGQAALVVFFLVMEWLSPYRDQEELAKGNLALGLHQAGMLLCLGMVLSACVAGDFSNWSRDLAEFAYAAGKGMLLLLLFSWLTDRALLRRTTMAQEIARDQNPAAVLTCLGVKLSLAVLVVHTML